MTTYKPTFEEASGLGWPEAQMSLHGGSVLRALQAAGPPERAIAQHGPHALMLAILEDAIWCLGRIAHASRARRSDPVGQRARAWVLERGSDWIFSFENVCEELGLDAERLRAALLPSARTGELDSLVRRRSHTVRSVHVGARPRRREDCRTRAA